MNILNYDFESALEQGFKTLFDASDVELRIADDLGQGELPDETVMLEIDVGGAISDERLNNAGEYDNYSGGLTLTIWTPRVSGDEVPTNAGFKSRHRELVATVRQLLEEIGASELSTYWSGALSPTKITPTGTERGNDEGKQQSILTYAMQFRIA